MSSTTRTACQTWCLRDCHFLFWCRNFWVKKYNMTHKLCLEMRKIWTIFFYLTKECCYAWQTVDVNTMRQCRQALRSNWATLSSVLFTRATTNVFFPFPLHSPSCPSFSLSLWLGRKEKKRRLHSMHEPRWEHKEEERITYSAYLLSSNRPQFLLVLRPPQLCKYWHFLLVSLSFFI